MSKADDVIRARDSDGCWFPYEGTYPLEDDEKVYYSAAKVDELLERQREACFIAYSRELQRRERNNVATPMEFIIYNAKIGDGDE